jgi:adenylate cyclase
VTVRRVLLAQLLAIAGGALAVAVYLRLLFVDLSHEAGFNEGDGEALAVYLTAIVIIALPLNAVVLDRSLGWVRSDRTPSARERWWTVAQPVAQSLTAFGVWLGAAAIFAVLNRGGETGLRIALGIALAGIINCCLLELLLARHFRPVFALALARAPLPRWRGEVLTRVMVGWTLGSAVPLLAIGLALFTLPEDALALSAHRLAVLVFTGVVLGGLVLRAAAGAVTGRLEEVIDAQAQVEADHLDVRLDVTNIGEVGRLQHGFNAMVAGLRERRRLQDLFGRQVGLDVTSEALGREPRLGGESREITALFVDLEGFTAFTESHSPEEVVAELNRFFAVVIRVVHDDGGWVNTFEGDAALCIFGAPKDQADHAARALRVATSLPRAVAALATPEPGTGRTGVPRVGIGVATGSVVVGNIGTPERYEYTVIGDAVNVAARLTELAKRPFHGVLASEETMRAAARAEGSGATTPGVAGGWREAGTVVLRGRSRPTRLFEPTMLTVTDAPEAPVAAGADGVWARPRAAPEGAQSSSEPGPAAPRRSGGRATSDEGASPEVGGPSPSSPSSAPGGPSASGGPSEPQS